MHCSLETFFIDICILSFFMSLFLSLSLFLSVFLSWCLFLCVYLLISRCGYLSMCISPRVCLHARISSCLSFRPYVLLSLSLLFLSSFSPLSPLCLLSLLSLSPLSTLFSPRSSLSPLFTRHLFLFSLYLSFSIFLFSFTDYRELCDVLHYTSISFHG